MALSSKFPWFKLTVAMSIVTPSYSTFKVGLSIPVLLDMVCKYSVTMKGARLRHMASPPEYTSHDLSCKLAILCPLECSSLILMLLVFIPLLISKHLVVPFLTLSSWDRNSWASSKSSTHSRPSLLYLLTTTLQLPAKHNQTSAFTAHLQK